MTSPATQPQKDTPVGRRWGLYAAAGITAYLFLVDAAFRPLHAAGWLQSVFDYLNALGAVLEFPGLAAEHLTRSRLRLSLPAPAVFIVVFNAGFYYVAGYLLAACWRWAFSPRRTSAQARVEGLLSRRRFLGGGLTVMGGGAAAALGYGLGLEPRNLEVSRRTFRLRGLPPSLDGLRAVQVTDIHHGPWLSLARVREVVDAVNELRPDLVLLTGDYVDEEAVYTGPVVAELARLRPTIGTVAVLGNHDWFEDAPLMRREFARVGILLLDNGRLVLTPERRLVRSAAHGLALCGVGDLKEDRPDYRLALDGLPAAMPRVLLSHNPDVAEEPSLTDSDLRVDLIVSGHTHGGQIRLPFVGAPIIPSRYGQKYRGGLVQGPVCPVFICRGIGVSGVPVRVGATPELAVLEFRAG